MEMTSSAWNIYESPLGPLTLIAGPTGLRSVLFPGRSPRLDPVSRDPLSAVTGQLDRYFTGDLEAFEIELDLRGGALEAIVWSLLLEIPYGQTTSYGELAGRVDPAAYPEGLEPYKRPRLVGAAVGRTPTPIVVPCHRVIGADGSLIGYGGGLQRKQALLDLERGVPDSPGQEPGWECASSR
jgi:methylated-DNA-[protein]-cysteine S-methyltransferase